MKDTIIFDVAKARQSEAGIRAKLDTLDKNFKTLQTFVGDSATWWEGTSHDELARRADAFFARKPEIANIINGLADNLAMAISEKLEEERITAEFIAAQAAALEPAERPEASLDWGPGSAAGDDWVNHDGFDAIVNSGHLSSIGFTPSEIMAMWYVMSDADREFFMSLDGTDDGYARAFRTDPNDLSDIMTEVLATYSAKLLKFDEHGNATPESCRQIELFSNAILKSDRQYKLRMEDGTEQESTREYRDVYLEKIYVGTSLLLKSDAIMLASMDKGSIEYNKLYAEYSALYPMMNFWTTQILVIAELKFRSMWIFGDRCIPYLEISELSFEDGEVEYDLDHRSGKEHVKTELLPEGTQVKHIWELETLRKLQEAEDTAMQKMIANMLKGGAILAATAISPALAILISTMCMIMDDSAGTVSGLDGFTESQAAKLGLKGTNLVAKELINGILAWQKASKALSIADHQKKIEWFGSGGYYEATSNSAESYRDLSGVSFSEIINPDTIFKIYRWETEGIRGWAQLDDATCENILGKIAKKNGTDSQVYEDCYALMYGGYDIFGETDMLRFLTAINAFSFENFIVERKWLNFLDEDI